MTQIKIEVPANDHIALSAMADALQRIAAERAPSVTVGSSPVEQCDSFAKQYEEFKNPKGDDFVEPSSSMSSIAKGYKAAVDEDLQRKEFKVPDSAVDVELNRLDEEFEAYIHHENTKHDEAFEEAVAATEQDDTLDADGIPHDNRIHSKGATRLADNTWRLRKRPADKTEEEWTTYIDSVKAELKAVQDIPSETTVTDVNDIEYRKTQGVIAPNCEVEVTLDEQAVADLTPPVIDEPATQLEGVTPNGDVAIEPPVTTTGTPVAPVTPPTSLTPPVVEADKPSVTTFQELMLYMTSDAKKRGADNDMIKATLLEVDPALTAIPLIATRADLIPKFVEALEAKLK